MNYRFDLPTSDEMKLVFDAWANSFRKSPWAGCVPNHLWDSVSRASAEELVRRSRVLVVLAATYPGIFEERRVAGYSVSEPDLRCLHWLFVKRDYRRQGYGTALLNETVRSWQPGDWVYTHRTRASTHFLGDRFSWDPVPARVKRD